MKSRLRVLPTIDDSSNPGHEAGLLRLPRHEAARLGRTAATSIRQGWYEGPTGERIDWEAAVRHAVRSKVSIPPAAPLPEAPAEHDFETEVLIANISTLQAAEDLTRSGFRPLVLNFANGVRPGGGFLNGARAQEEGLCFVSALYATLEGDEMYAEHATRELPDSTDWAILSPRVPVFRRGAEALPEPWLVDFITCAAPYAPRVGRQRSAELLGKRIGRVLAIARAYGYTDLVLGAWGCGAFRNDPRRTAEDFRSALEGRFAGDFRKVVFAIIDWSEERRYLGPFRDVFEGRH